MSKKEIFTKNREQAKLLRWLQLAISNDDSCPVLGGIHIQGNKAEASDGFRAHWSRTPLALRDFDDDVICIRNGRKLHKSPNRI